MVVLGSVANSSGTFLPMLNLRAKLNCFLAARKFSYLVLSTCSFSDFQVTMKRSLLILDNM